MVSQWPARRLILETSTIAAVQGADPSFVPSTRGLRENGAEIGSFLLTVELFHLQLTILAFLLTTVAFSLAASAFLLAIGALFAYSGKVRLTSTLRDCKQRNLTVSKKTPTVSKKLPPFSKNPFWDNPILGQNKCSLSCGLSVPLLTICNEIISNLTQKIKVGIGNGNSHHS